MLKSRVIPCLDVKDGRVVKGINFTRLVDAGDPVEQARIYDAQGADELCFLDITASSDNRETILDVIERTASVCFMPLTVGGGVRSVGDIRRLLMAGADKVSINTTAVINPALVKRGAEQFGSQCIVVAIDVKQIGSDLDYYEIYTHGGRKATGLEAVAWAKYMAHMGAGELLVTSMNRDGTRSGFDIGITRRIVEAVSIPVIASGGVGTLDHLADGVKKGLAHAVLAASIFHFGNYTINQAKQHMAKRGVAVRL